MNAPELDYITVKGFKSIASVEKLALGPINVLVGPNGSGKSNFVGVFSFLHAIREGRLQDYVRKAGGAEQVLHFGSKVTSEIRLHISFLREVNQYTI
jgi:predicted ATPase